MLADLRTMPAQIFFAPRDRHARIAYAKANAEACSTASARMFQSWRKCRTQAQPQRWYAMCSIARRRLPMSNASQVRGRVESCLQRAVGGGRAWFVIAAFVAAIGCAGPVGTQGPSGQPGP